MATPPDSPEEWARAFAAALRLHLREPTDDLSEMIDWGLQLYPEEGHREPVIVAAEIWQNFGDPPGPAH